MKVFIIPFLLCLTFISYAQEWDIFPVGHRNYYVLSDGEKVTCRYVDYVRNDSNKSVHYFSNGINQYCKPDVIPQTYTTHSVYDSLIENGDHYQFKINGWPKQFFHKVPPGFSWDITFGTSTNGYDILKITYDSIYYGSFLNLNDSLKIYSIQAFLSNTPVQHPINDKKIILSKHFGFIKTNIFNDWETLIGIKNDSINIGFDPPEIEDFMKYQVGDIYKWKEEVRYTEFNPIKIVKIDYWYRDSISSIESTNEKFTFYFNRKIRKIDVMNPSTPEEIYEQQTHYERFIFSDYRNMFIGSNPGMISSGNFAPQEYILYKTEALIVDTFGQELLVSAAFHTYLDLIDTLSCNLISIPDNGYSFVLNTRLGITYEGKEFLYGDSKKFLIGYNTAHAGIGGDYFPIGINDINAEDVLSIYPNPADNSLVVDFKDPSNLNIEYSLFDLKGRSVKRGIINRGDPIDVSSLTSGVYILQLKNEVHSISKKIIIK